MALGTNHESATTLAVLIPEKWSSRINDFARAKLIAGNFFLDLSEDFIGGGDTLHIPNLSEMTANLKVNGSEVTLNNNTETKVDLTVDTWYETSFLIEKKEIRQVLQSYNLQERYAMNAGHTTAKTLETAIFALFKTFTNTVGSSTANLAPSNIRAAIEYLDTNDVPDEDRAFFLHPSVLWGDLMSQAEFTYNSYTPTMDPIMKGVFGYLYGIPVYKSSNLPYISGTSGRVGFLGHRDAIAWASGPLDIESNYIPSYLGVLTTADMMFGVVKNINSYGVYMLAQ